MVYLLSWFTFLVPVIILGLVIFIVLRRVRKETGEGPVLYVQRLWRESPVDAFFMVLAPVLGLIGVPFTIFMIAPTIGGSGSGGQRCPSILACYRAEKPSGNIEGFLNHGSWT